MSAPWATRRRIARYDTMPTSVPSLSSTRTWRMRCHSSRLATSSMGSSGADRHEIGGVISCSTVTKLCCHCPPSSRLAADHSATGDATALPADHRRRQAVQPLPGAALVAHPVERGEDPARPGVPGAHPPFDDAEVLVDIGAVDALGVEARFGKRAGGCRGSGRRPGIPRHRATLASTTALDVPRRRSSCGPARTGSSG